MTTNFKKKLLEFGKYPMNKQKELLDDFFVEWKKDYKQIDDVLVLGFKVV